MHVVFANTGVQLVCHPLASKIKGAATEHGWQRCACLEPDESISQYHFIQWRLRKSGGGRADQLFFAVDTTCGSPDKGFFCSPDALAGDFHVALTQLVGSDGQPLSSFPRVDIVIRPATASGGEPIPVNLVIDFGNSRTGGLLIESGSDPGAIPLMDPFELINRFQFDMWDEYGEFKQTPSARWFSSRTQWSNSPYLPPPTVEMKVYGEGETKPSGGLLSFKRGPKQTQTQTVQVMPRLFQDLSAVRMGREGDDITQIMQSGADVPTGVSSPKRYLWAGDNHWLGGAIWHMADPYNRFSTETYSSVLKGPFFRFLTEQDSDELDLPDIDSDEIDFDESSREAPIEPRHAPRVFMVAALYEILCQTYSYLNSIGHRRLIGDTGQPRELVSLALTFPSGMIAQERERFRLQAQKAVDMFHATLGRSQYTKPSVAMSIDEASAVHLTYIWSELQTLDKNAGLWFTLMGKSRPEAIDQDTEAASGASPARVSQSADRRKRMGRDSGIASIASQFPEVRIGCIDIGGGTSDLMIAKYAFEPGHVHQIRGEMLHRDGISLAGDQLVKRLIERVIIPQFADRVNLETRDVMLLFGEEKPLNHGFRQERIRWMNRLFVPLAQAYLQLAVDGDEQSVISHTDPEYVDPEVVLSLQQRIDKQYGAGYSTLDQDLGLRFESELFNEIVFEVFNDLLQDFCSRLMKYDVDVVLLAGQPTKLKQLQQFVQQNLPLPSSRVLPLHNHYAGSWYPYQDVMGSDPGVIVDPKSAVVVGAAIEFLISRGKLGMIQFQMQSILDQAPSQENDYYWGLITNGTFKIENSRLLFTPPEAGEQPQRVERKEFPVVAEEVLIGRRLSPSENAEASPVWALRIDRGRNDGPIDLTVVLERRRASPRDNQPETLELVDVKGTVAGEPADMHEGPGQNVFFYWRTLAHEAYFLDTGALDCIEM
jgi:hypothetical protein